MRRSLTYDYYDDGQLTGLGTAALIIQEWQTGRYSSLAEVTTAVHNLHQDIPRSAVFWLAYHTLCDGRRRDLKISYN